MTRELLILAVGVVVGGILGYHVGRFVESLRWVNRQTSALSFGRRCPDYEVMSCRSVN
jgi:hypothetical protein